MEEAHHFFSQPDWSLRPDKKASADVEKRQAAKYE